MNDSIHHVVRRKRSCVEYCEPVVKKHLIDLTSYLSSPSPKAIPVKYNNNHSSGGLLKKRQHEHIPSIGAFPAEAKKAHIDPSDLCVQSSQNTCQAIVPYRSMDSPSIALPTGRLVLATQGITTNSLMEYTHPHPNQYTVNNLSDKSQTLALYNPPNVMRDDEECTGNSMDD